MGKASRGKRDRRGSGSAWPRRGRQPPRESGVARGHGGSEGSRLSEALAQLIEPYLEHCGSLHAYEVLVAVGALAWNLASYPPKEQEQALAETLSKMRLPAKELENLGSLLPALAARKRALFPADRRLIAGYEVHSIPTGYYLTVASISFG